VALVDAAERKPGKREPYKKRAAIDGEFCPQKTNEEMDSRHSNIAGTDTNGQNIAQATL
jgi:hypothetical protein